MLNTFFSEPKTVISHETGHYNNRVSFTAAQNIKLGDFIGKDGSPLKIDMTQDIPTLIKAFNSVIGIALDNYKAGEKAVAINGNYDDTLFNAEAIRDLEPLFAAIDAADRQADDAKILVLSNALRALSMFGYETTHTNRQTLKVEAPGSNSVPDNVFPRDTSFVEPSGKTSTDIEPIGGVIVPSKPKPQPKVSLVGITGATKSGHDWIANAGDAVEFELQLSGAKGETFDVVIYDGAQEIGETINMGDGAQKIKALEHGSNQQLTYVVKFKANAPVKQVYTAKVHEHGVRNASLHEIDVNILVQGKLSFTKWDDVTPVDLTFGQADAVLLAAQSYEFNNSLANTPITYTVDADGTDITPAANSIADPNADNIKYDATKIVAGMNGEITISFSDTEDAPLTNATANKTLTIGTVTPKK